MHTLEQLLFAQHFPFSNATRRIVAEENISLSELPEQVVERAELMAEHAFQGKKYVFELRQSELLLQEVLAFPVAKIIVSFAKDPVLYARFSKMVADSGHSFLGREKDKKDVAVKLATDLGISFDFPEHGDFFVSLPLQEFLSIRFNDQSLKLVNQFVSNGQVFLDLNDFAKFLREKSYSVVFSSLPVPVSGLPQRLQAIANRLRNASKQREQRIFKEAFKGKVSPDSFPECIASMYSQLASGQKIPHMANFTLAAFLNSIGMPKEQIIALFKKSPNFKERIARYQIDRIVKQNYAPPSCEKIKAYGICPNTSCNTRHPITFYRRKMRIQTKPLPKEGQGKSLPKEKADNPLPKKEAK